MSRFDAMKGSAPLLALTIVLLALTSTFAFLTVSTVLSEQSQAQPEPGLERPASPEQSQEQPATPTVFLDES